MLLLFALSGGLAQTPPNLVNCGQLSVEFVPVEYTGTNHGSSCSYCCGAGTISCQRIMYNVYLRAENITGGLTLPSNGNFDLAYTELYITLRCIPKVTVRKMLLRLPNESACQPMINDPDPGDSPYCSPLMENFIQGSIATEQGCWVTDVNLSITAESGIGCDHPMLVAGSSGDECGPYTTGCICDIETADAYTLTPEKNDNPLNGVTTYDLVLISQHILGIEPFDSPYKMIAADANKSNSITTFDIVELRKLILGIYTELPNNTSWRFVPKAFVFPNANNPFQTTFPEGINCLGFPSSGNDFVAIKVGDVNNTATGNRPGERPVVGLGWPNHEARPGDVLTVPVRYLGADALGAIQLGLRFDPGKLRLIGPSIGDIESYLPGNFNLLRADAGEIRTLWLPMTDDAGPIRPGSVLFNLYFEALDDLSNGALPLWLDHGLLDCAAWLPGGMERRVAQTPVARRDAPAIPSGGLTASVAPNPTSGGITLSVRSARADKGRVALFDAFGQGLLMRELDLHEGAQDIPLHEVASLPAGVYLWKVYTPGLETRGQLVKQ